MSKQRTRRQKAILRRRIFLSFCAVILAAVIALTVFIVKSIFDEGDENIVNSGEKPQNSANSNKPLTESYATVLSTGDIMVHSTQLDGAKVGGGYDFSAFFKESSDYFKNYDLNIANLEVTFGGTESGPFSGYPAFNTPDVLADNIKDSGLNFLVTANNHSYDTGMTGLVRTAKVLKEKGIDFIGTKENKNDNMFAVKEINGIKIGMANFTYSSTSGDRKNLNGNVLKSEAGALVSTFDYNNLTAFYQNAQTYIKTMKLFGAEFIVFYLHWGNEYQLKPNTWQKTIAQKLSNMGVDIIVGSHPHVIQPVELIHSEDGQNTTVCVYSTGNAVSNQRQELMDSCPSGHTEDGMFFTYKLKKVGDEVTLVDLDIIPTWVNKYKGGSGHQYTIYPLENANDGAEKYGLDSTAAAKAKKSYERTKALVADGLTKCQQNIGCDVTFK